MFEEFSTILLLGTPREKSKTILVFIYWVMIDLEREISILEQSFCVVKVNSFQIFTSQSLVQLFTSQCSELAEFGAIIPTFQPTGL